MGDHFDDPSFGELARSQIENIILDVRAANRMDGPPKNMKAIDNISANWIDASDPQIQQFRQLAAMDSLAEHIGLRPESLLKPNKLQGGLLGVLWSDGQFTREVAKAYMGAWQRERAKWDSPCTLLEFFSTSKSNNFLLKTSRTGDEKNGSAGFSMLTTSASSRDAVKIIYDDRLLELFSTPENDRISSTFTTKSDYIGIDVSFVRRARGRDGTDTKISLTYFSAAMVEKFAEHDLMLPAFVMSTSFSVRHA